MDMGFTGPGFTWTRGNITKSFNDADWIEHYAMKIRIFYLNMPQSLIYLSRNLTTPLLIKLFEGADMIPKIHFRFQAAWLTHSNFQNVEKTNWENNASLLENLTYLKEVFEKWNKEHFGNVFSWKKKKSLGQTSRS